MKGATVIKGVLTTLDSWLRSGVAAGPNVRWCWVLLGRLALSNRSTQVLRWQTGQWVVVVYAQRGRRVVAGSRLETECRVQQQYSTGWCLVESPDDESPSGPRNEEGHGRSGCLASLLLRWSVWGLRCAHLEEEAEREPWLAAAGGEDRLARA